METEQVLRQQFTAAIRKSFNPCPLIGEKWFNFHANGKPADLEFTGAGKLAKATCKRPEQVARTIVKNLALGKVAAEVEVTSDSIILVRLKESSAVQEA